jgi:hypothetical protein
MTSEWFTYDFKGFAKDGEFVIKISKVVVEMTKKFNMGRTLGNPWRCFLRTD